MFAHSATLISQLIKKYITRSSHRRCTVKKGVLTNFAKSTGKYLFQSLFFNKVAGLGLQLYWKRDPGTGVFLWILWNFQEHLFYRTHLNGCLWMLDTNVKVFHEIISCFIKWPGNCISWNALKEKFHSVSFPLANVNSFAIYYTIFKTTSVVRCSQYSQIFFIWNSVGLESPISQYSFLLFLTSWCLLLKLNQYLRWTLRLWGREKCICIKSNNIS